MSPASDLSPQALDAALALLGEVGGTGVLPMIGLSMRPTLPDGSEILVDFSARSFRPGDLVVFRQNQDVVVHRYLGRAHSPDRRPCLRTRGDGMPDRRDRHQVGPDSPGILVGDHSASQGPGDGVPASLVEPTVQVVQVEVPGLLG